MNINLTLIGQMITFIVFIAFTMKYVWPPITKALQDRQKRIAEGLAAAERSQQALVLAEAKSTEIIEEAKRHAATYIEEANKRALHIIDESKEEARKEGARIIQQAHEMIEIEKNKARESLRQEVGRFVVLGASKVLNQQIDQRANDGLIEKVVAEVINE